LIGLMVLPPPAYPVGRQDRHFYFLLFFRSRKAIIAINRLPKAISKLSTPKNIEIIS